MITVPTVELTGLLADVIPFADSEPDLVKLHCVQIEWDGSMLHAVTTDLWRMSWCAWHPDDIPPDEYDVQDELGVEWGGADDPWKLVLRLDDAQDLVNTYKVRRKDKRRTPLTVDLDRGMLRVRRDRDTGLPDVTMTLVGLDVEFPDPRPVIAAIKPSPVQQLAFNGSLLADFGRVRQRGPMHMRFAGDDRLTTITIGARFVGAIMPSKLPEEKR